MLDFEVVGESEVNWQERDFLVEVSGCGSFKIYYWFFNLEYLFLFVFLSFIFRKYGQVKILRYS